MPSLGQLVNAGSKAPVSPALSVRGPFLLLAGIMAVSVVFRLSVALALGDHIVELPGTYDQLSYDTLAHRVLAGQGFNFPTDWWPITRVGEPTAHWSFLYVLYLAGVYGLFGGHPLMARLLQAVIAGALMPLLAWRIAERTFGVGAAVVAAGLVAVYGYFVYYAGALMTETFFILAVLWGLDLAIGIAQAADVGSLWRPPTTAAQALRAATPWLLLGLALGIAALLRQLILLIVPLLFVWLVWVACRRRTPDSAQKGTDRLPAVIGGLLLSFLMIAILIAPWTIRNYQAFGRFVLLNTNSGYAFFWANHPIYGTSFVPILPGGTYQRLIPAELRSLDEAALDQALLRQGIRFVLDDPRRYILLSLSRVGTYFMFWPSAESGAASNVVRTLSYGLYLPLMLYGLCVAALRRRQRILPGQGPAVILLCAFAGVYSAIHLLSWALIRYRLPVDAALMPFAGLATVDLWERLGRSGTLPSFVKWQRAEPARVAQT